MVPLGIAENEHAYSFDLMKNYPFYHHFDPTMKPEIPMLSTEFKCKRVGRFAYPDSCEKYHFCWDTTHDHAVFTCPYNEAFNPKTQHCEIDFAICETAPKCKFDRQLFPNPEDKSTYFRCSFKSHGISDEHESNSQYRLYKENCYGGEFDTELGYCKLTAEDEDEDDSSEIDKSANKMECKEAGIFIDRSDDSRYYECIVKSVKYAKIHQTCPYDHVFSMADKRCIKLE